MSEYVVAVLGATGLVGQTLIELLERRNFPVKQLKPLASERSGGEMIPFHNKEVMVEIASPEAFEGVDLVLASAGGSVSQALVPEAVKRGAVVIDNTSCFRMHDNVPLVVAGVNDQDLTAHQGVIANPNCSTAQLMPVLKALHELGGLKRVVVSTYQSVSGAGKGAMDELAIKIHEVFHHHHHHHDENCNHGPEFSHFQRPIAFNLIPQIDVFMDEAPYTDYTKEEWKLMVESRKILNLPELPITATAVRVPVMVGHSEAVTIEFEKPVSVQQVMDTLKQTKHVFVAKTRDDYATPLEIEGEDPVYVGRIREDASNPGYGVNLWVVADNLMIGAALNAVRIAESLHEKKLITSKAQESCFSPSAV